MQWKELTSEDFTLQLQKHNNEKVESLLLFTFLQAVNRLPAQSFEDRLQ